MGDISDFAFIAQGEESQAYRFRCGDKAYVVRVNRGVEGFEKDVFAYRRFARPDLPIPEIIGIGPIDHHFFCISEKMPGVTLQDLGPEELPAVLEPTARVLHAIAESDLGGMSGFGPFGPNGAGEYESWRHFLNSIARDPRYDWAYVRRVLCANEVEPLLDRLSGLVEYCPEKRGLVHGDFGSNNVLTRGSGITGVVDWSEASIGDPLYDLANIFFWRTWLDCMERQACYFEMHPSPTSNLSARLLCYQLRIGLAEVYESAIESKMEVATWALARCRVLIQ
jgi:hygromycin-B 4-O-kinase